MIEQAEAMANTLDITEGISEAAKERAREDIKLLKTMKAQKTVMEKMVDAAKPFTGIAEGARDAFAQIKSNPIMGTLLLLMGALEKMVSAVNAEANNLNDTLGIGLVNSVGEATKQMADMPASSMLETMGLAPQVASRAREAANQAALASNNLDLMHNTTIGINDATAALDYGMQVSQISEMADSLDVATNLTREQASAAINAAAAFAKQNKVAPKKVLQDMANNAGVLAKYSDGTAEGMARAATQAAKLGMELSSVGQVMDGLLDLESSIASEFEASVLLGKDLNLDRARTLALNNDIEGAMNEIVKQVGTEADFQAMNAVQRQALADSVGVSVDDLSQMMAKGGKAKLDDNFPEATLKRTEDLVKAAGIRDNFLAKIVSLLTGALAFLGTSGLMGKLTDMAMAFGRRGRGMKVGRGGMTSMQRLKQMRRSGRSVGGIKPSRFQMVKNAGMDKFRSLKARIPGSRAVGEGIKATRGAVSGAARTGARMLGRIALPLAAVADGLHLFKEFSKEGATTKSKSGAVGSVAGGWAAAAGGAKLGAALGTLAGPIGTAVGGVLGGAAGYIVGSKLGKAVGGGIADMGKKIGPKVTAAMNSMGTSVNKFASQGKAKLMGWATDAGAKFTQFKDKAGPVLSNIKDKFIQVAKQGGPLGIALKKSRSAMLSMGKAAATKVSSGLDKAKAALNSFAQSGGIKGFFSRVASGARDIVLGAKEQGGPIGKSGTYLVGEAGPELVNLSRGSNVVPNNQLQGKLESGAGTGDLIGAISALRTELRAINSNTKRGAEAAERTKVGASV